MSEIELNHGLRLRRLTQFSSAVGGLTVAVGVSVLVGWCLDIGVLKRVFPGLVTMKANTAVGFVLLGLALWLQATPSLTGTLRIRFARGCAAMVLMLGLLTLVEYVFGLDLRIDQILFQEANPKGLLPFPGRMAHATALNFAMLGTAMLVFKDESGRRLRLVQFLALAGSLVGLLAVAGYLYGVRQFYSLVQYVAVALHTAIVFVLYGFAILCARPGAGLMAVLTHDYQGGLVARRMLPLVLTLPFLTAWLGLKGQQAGWYNPDFGLALLGTSNVVIFAGVVWWNARSLNRLDARHRDSENTLRESEARFRSLVECLPQLIWTCQPDGRCDFLSRQWIEYTGLPAEALLGTAWLAQIHPDDRARLETAWRAAVVEGAEFHHEFRIRRHDGFYGWFDTRAVPSRAATGRVTRWFGVNTDITGHKQAEERLQQAKEELEQRVRERTAELAARNAELTEAIENVKELSGLLPICAYCKKIRDANQYWDQVESYVSRHTNAKFSHGICPDCIHKHFPDVDLSGEP